MYFLKYWIVTLLLALPFHVFAFDPSCFREKSESIDNPASSLQIAVESLDENVYFVQDEIILPSRILSTEKNPPVRYTLTGIYNSDALRDFDPRTQVELDPYTLSQGDIILTIDLGRVFEKNTIHSFIDYTTQSNVLIEVSQDGESYFSVSRASLSDFSFRYVRITFRKVSLQSTPTVIRSIDFFENVSMRFFVEASKSSPILAYRGLVCDTKLFSIPLVSPSLEITTGSYSTLVFQANPLYKNDYDQDGVENIADVCPYVADSDQKDRNFDGRGDACSDDDSDGIVGSKDNCPIVSNPDQKDLNVNALGDVCEFDTDSDGVVDGIDNAIHTKNPDQKDADNDRIGDVIDNCNLYNPDQLDLDSNGRGDVCDRDGEYRKINDTDNDGILDFSDNCRYGNNPDQKDTDNDRIGDLCDNCINLQNPNQDDIDKNGKGDMCEDADKDGIEGWRDNCPSIANSDQKDADNNNIGNACTDTDNDSYFDSLDVCPLLYDKDQNDIDHDGIGDLCDIHDDRFLESNKYLFMGLIGFFGLLFIAGIFILLRKLH